MIFSSVILLLDQGVLVILIPIIRAPVVSKKAKVIITTITKITSTSYKNPSLPTSLSLATEF